MPQHCSAIDAGTRVRVFGRSFGWSNKKWKLECTYEVDGRSSLNFWSAGGWYKWEEIIRLEGLRTPLRQRRVGFWRGRYTEDRYTRWQFAAVFNRDSSELDKGKNKKNSHFTSPGSQKQTQVPTLLSVSCFKKLFNWLRNFVGRCPF